MLRKPEPADKGIIHFSITYPPPPLSNPRRTTEPRFLTTTASEPRARRPRPPVGARRRRRRTRPRPAVVGLAAGALGALAAARLLERTVTGMLPAEPFTFALMVAILTLAALLASFVPARRASLVDPVRTLRQD